MSDPIYLDHNATTPIAEEVFAAMAPWLREQHGNPASSHAYGRRAAQAVATARAQVAALIGAQPDEIVFTGCATEANNSAVLGVTRAIGTARRRIVISAVEHPAVTAPALFLREQGWDAIVVPVDGFGRVSLEALERALGAETALVSVMHANNEVGTLQDIREIARLARQRGIVLHSDAAQSAGKVPLNVDDLGVDLLTLAGHKFYAPKGVGALYVRRGTPIRSVLHGADQEYGLRPGTENVDALLRHEQTVLASRQQQVQAQIEGTQRRLALLALAVVGLSIVLAWRTTISVTRPLSRVEQAADRIAGGDYKARVAATSDDELGRVAQAMNAMADAVAAREAQLEGVAYIDRLTGLPNRAMLRRQAREGGWASEGIAVILMDVARLCTVNEVLGFETGDMLLVAVAKRLQAAVAAEPGASGRTTLARLPGGVFAVLCEGRGRVAMEAVRKRLDAQLAKSLACDGHAVDVNLVFGLAEGGPAAGDADERVRALDGALQGAELAIAEAKRLKLAWAWHTPTDDESRTRQLSLLSDLRRAATEGELEMWLQPKQCLRRGRTLGMEGLVRWRHPQRGFISPAEFIPFAERTGHIGVVTTAMLEAGLATLAGWTSSHPDLSLAVNVSALDVRDPGFVSHVEQMARRHRAPLSRLRLEITESSVMEDADRVLPVLHGLRDLGVQLSIDDFGTGYSSLAYLQRLPVSELKIDRGFVAGADRSVEARALLKTIIDLGHSLKMIVTAEGVERTEEQDLLIELGCDQAQGYLISRPLAPDAARQYIEAVAERPVEVALA